LLSAPVGLTREELSWVELACGAATRGARFEAGGRPAAFRRAALTVFGAANTVRAVAGDGETVAWLGGTENFWFAGFCSRDAAATLPDSFELSNDDLQPHLGLLRARWEDPHGDHRIIALESPRVFTSAAPLSHDRRELNGDPGVVHLWPDTPSERDALWAAAIAASRLPDGDFALYLGLLTRRDAVQIAPDGSLLGRVFNATVREIDGPKVEALPTSYSARPPMPAPTVEPERVAEPPAQGRSSRGVRLAAAVGITAAGTALAIRPRETIAVGVFTTAVLGLRKYLRFRHRTETEPRRTASPADDLASAYRRRSPSPKKSSQPPARTSHNNGEDDWK
jgi:hypothetical protein